MNSWWEEASFTNTSTSAATWQTPALDEMVRLMCKLEEKYAPKMSPLPYACSCCGKVSPKEPTDPRYFVTKPVYYSPGSHIMPPVTFGPPIAYACRVCFFWIQQKLK